MFYPLMLEVSETFHCAC